MVESAELSIFGLAFIIVVFIVISVFIEKAINRYLGGGKKDK